MIRCKGNQGRLNKAFEEKKFLLKELNNPEHDSYVPSDGSREETVFIVYDVPDELIGFTFEWERLKKLYVAVSFHIIAEQKKEPKMTVRYYISSADLTQRSSPQQLETTGTWRISCTGASGRGNE